MSQSFHRTADRRAGFILIAVFTLGLAGGLLATFINGGTVPSGHAVVSHQTSTTTHM